MAFNKEKAMDAARKFVDKGQIDKAVKEYLRIVSEDPKDVRVWLKIGDLYAKKGAKQEAIETYVKVARFYHEQGFVDKAIAVYRQILKIDARHVDAILKLADLLRQKGSMIEAMQHLESVAAHFHREGNTKDALGTVAQLVQLDPENIATRIKLAELYSKEQLVEEAAREFEIACNQLRQQGRQDDFIKVAERLLWHKPQNHALTRELAGLYLRRNDPRRALQKLQACFKADPRDVETLGLLAQAFQALDQKAKTVSVLKELARVHVENKNRDKAADVYRKILEFVPTDPDAKDFLGNMAPAAGVQQRVQPPPRPAATPFPPAAVRADLKLNLTTDLPAFTEPQTTGSMPLVDDGSFSGVDFALPEYDDGDFSSNMEPGPDPRLSSAAGEMHAEEISKILAETDVYVKYGLHQKAVDHLRRVFTLDPDNVEAHERLKDIFISQGREEEAEVELLKLAEVVAPGDPDRAETYLHELLAINGTHTGAFDLARRFQLRVTRTSSATANSMPYGGGVATVDPEGDDLALDSPRQGQRPMGVARHHRDPIDDFDPLDLVGGAQGSPAPSRPPQRPPQAPYDFDDFDPGMTAQQTYEQSVAYTGGELDDASVIEDQLDDAAIDDEIDSQVAAELGAHHELPFDPAAARAFDAGVNSRNNEPTYNGGNYVDVALPPAEVQGYDDDALAVSGSYDPYATAGEPRLFDPTANHEPAPQAGDAHGRAETFVEDDLDEADFYAGQGLYAEAIDSLHVLLEHYPNHPLVLNKLREVESLMGGGDGQLEDPIEIAADSIEQEVSEVGTSTDAMNLDDLEEMPMEELEDIESGIHLAASVGKKKRGPTVMLEKPVDEGDADTHYDLGLAYKEMGLHDDAIKAFEKALPAPGREVGCRLMIGMCQRETGNSSEAIHQFKQALHANPSDRERQSLYYELGVTYQAINDAGEALYYLEMVLKRDPKFADAVQRAAQLRDEGGHAQHAEDEL